MEWELGSRVTNDVLSENTPWGNLVIENRVSVANPNAPLPVRLRDDGSVDYTDCWIMLEGKGETENVYLCEKYMPDGRLYCEQIVGKDVNDKDGQRAWYYIPPEMVIDYMPSEGEAWTSQEATA